MKVFRALFSFLMLCLGLSSCGGDSGGNTVNNPPPPVSHEFLYVTGAHFSDRLGLGSYTVASYSIDQSTGALTFAGLAEGAGQSHGLAVHPSKKFLYVNGESNAEVDGYSLDSATGNLTLVGKKPITIETSAGGLALGPGGKFLYQAQLDLPTSTGVENDLHIYSVDQATGNFTFVSTTLFSNSGFITRAKVLLNPSETLLYVSCPDFTTSICAFSVDASTGALTQLSFPQPSLGTSIGDMVMHPNGKFLYVLAGNPTRNVQVFSIDASTGAPSTTPIASVPIGNVSNSVAVDPQGKFLYATDAIQGVYGFSIDASSGVLTAVAGSPWVNGGGPDVVTVDPSGQFVYTSNSGEATISEFKINAQTGALQAVTGSPFVPYQGTLLPTGLVAVRFP